MSDIVFLSGGKYYKVMMGDFDFCKPVLVKMDVCSKNGSIDSSHCLLNAIVLHMALQF